MVQGAILAFGSSGRTRTYNPSVNSRRAYDRLALQTQDLEARKVSFHGIWTGNGTGNAGNGTGNGTATNYPVSGAVRSGGANGVIGPSPEPRPGSLAGSLPCSPRSGSWPR